MYVLRGNSKSLFVSYMKPYRANHKAGSLLHVFPWMWWQSSSLSIRWDPQSGPAALTHSIVRSLCMDQVRRLYGPVVFGEGLWTLYVVWFFTYIACIVRLISCNKIALLCSIAINCFYGSFYMPRPTDQGSILINKLILLGQSNLCTQVLNMYIFSPFGWSSYWPLEVQGVRRPFF